MKTVTMNPSALTAITAWLSAREAEKSWQEYRRKLEDQILDLHPGLLESLETELNASQHLSVAAEVGSLKIEVKRSLDLDQPKICAILAEAPFLAGVLVRCEWKPVASRSMFGALAGQGEIAEKLKDAVSFRAQKPYFSPV